MRVAIVHDWLTFSAGSERVLQQMLQVFPEADLFSLVDFLPNEERSVILHKKVHTSFIQKLPRAKKWYRHYLPLMPLAVEQFDMSSYDLVISSSHAVAKGVITGPGQLHLCMCYSPIRYAWDLQHQYLKDSDLHIGLKGMFAKLCLHKMRVWDYRTSNGVDHFMAISKFIAERIYKIYRRESTVIYPPVDVDKFTLCEQKDDFYFTASRLVPYKNVDLIVRAFTKMPDKKLVIIGDGPEYKKILSQKPSNVTMLGYQPFDVLKDTMQRAKAFIFAAIEDFGIAPIEAQSCGTPVIGLAKGALVETIAENSGHFFNEQKEESLIDAVNSFKSLRPKDCRENALRFSSERFRNEFREHVRGHYESTHFSRR